MKIFTAILLLSFVTTFAQNLTIDELVSLRRKDVAQFEEYLTQKNWSLLSVEEATDNKMSRLIFAYKKDDYKDTAQSFIELRRDDTFGEHRLKIQILIKEKYTSYIERIKSLGCKLIDSKIKEGEITKTYQGKTTTFKIKVKTIKENDYSETKYLITLYDNDDLYYLIE